MTEGTKKHYIKPKIKFVKWEFCDVITSSTCDLDGCTGINCDLDGCTGINCDLDGCTGSNLYSFMY